MSKNPKTPGVYIEEITVFPPSVAEVESAIPAFVGYTEKATRVSANDLHLKPTAIFSLTEYESLFGGPRAEVINVTVTGDGVATPFSVAVTPPAVSYLMHYSMQMFFANGGGKCYIVSVGAYPAGDAVPALQVQDLNNGLAKVAEEDEPTLLLIPEATEVVANDYQTLAQAMLNQCGDLQDRFAILDIHGGDVALDAAALLAARGRFGTNNLKYGAAYYPFLRTTITHFVKPDESNVSVVIGAAAGVALGTLQTTNTGVYNTVRAALKDHYVVLPPGPSVAGVYAATDTLRGVWKAPANVSLANVIEPTVRLDDRRQEDFNVDATTGKSINALRAFAGKGTLVWGARTLAGNDNEWRYISVRRFFNMVEESVKKATSFAVFEPNEANTWVRVRGMVENFLTQKWREGALAGAIPRDAFFVRCGLGTTMNAQDILEGRMNVEIGLAVVRPAEFIILKFSHKLQTS